MYGRQLKLSFICITQADFLGMFIEFMLKCFLAVCKFMSFKNPFRKAIMNLHAYGLCYFNVQDIIIKTFGLQFIITKGPMSRPALSVCLRLFQTVQLAHDFITKCV